ncbi:hypothetical protein ACTXLJ_05475 [Psychrobacter celer]|uniref:hypothetical protein n=1 Tax=Psychrobacter celer TaxID=306572 RepID=UPI003FD177C5
MSNMMIYAPLSAIGGTIENVWGTEMRVRTIDSSNKDEVEQAKADGWQPKADGVIEQIETEKLEAENKVMKGKLDGGRVGDTANNSRIDELEEQLSTALTEIAGFEQEREESDKVIDEKIARIAELEQKLAIYEESKDANGNGKVDYEEMTIPILSTLLKNRKVDHNVRDGKDALIKLAQDSE